MSRKTAGSLETLQDVVAITLTVYYTPVSNGIDHSGAAVKSNVGQGQEGEEPRGGFPFRESRLRLTLRMND
jgi:hypothetical protein